MNVRRKLMELVDVRGKDVALDLLREFGCSTPDDLDASRYAEFAARADALMADD